MGSFYHVSNDKLKMGTILRSKYGETVCNERFFVNNHQGYTLYLKEKIFEEIRIEEFPSFPSRIKSIYLVTDLESAIKYKEDKEKKYIYEVETENADEALSVDMSWMDLSMFQRYEVVREMARYYYNQRSVNDDCCDWGIYEGSDGKIDSFWETLYEGKVTIKRLVTSGKI
ncbi:DUF2441 domain-containing protein [Bacillus toyonensis]|nr:DUF2441 domain-containing protein [Bacillus toyonensis]PAW46129.1 DUF2441 domain-containing protein [Bacillus toyonensis]